MKATIDRQSVRQSADHPRHAFGPPPPGSQSVRHYSKCRTAEVPIGGRLKGVTGSYRQSSAVRRGNCRNNIAQAEQPEKRPPAVSETGRSGPIGRAVRTGRVQRQVWRAFVSAPGQWTTVELAAWAYPRLRQFQEWHLKAVRRAAERLAVRVGRKARGVIVWVLKPDPSEVLSPQAIEDKGADTE
jgi:hypothetical protein